MTGEPESVIDGVEIRRAEESDLPAVLRLLADDPLGAKRERVADPLPDCYTTAFAAIEADPRNELVVGVCEGAVIGCLQLTVIPGLSRQGAERAQIESVRVARDRRDQGIDRRLFEWAIARARARGCHLVQLTTDKSRPDALRFYESLGFVNSHEGMKLIL